MYIMSTVPTTNAHRRGQATVEFALIVVILFTMLYGILEMSRLLFINAELENTAREGVDKGGGDYQNLLLNSPF